MKRLSALTLVNLPVALGATSPAASAGSLIWSTVTNTALQFDGTAWLSPTGPKVTVSTIAPSSPSVNDIWIKLT